MVKLNPDIDEYARPIEWAPAWSIGAPIPTVFSNGNTTIIVYYIDDVDNSWNGTYTKLISPDSKEKYFLGMVTFIGANSHRFGIVNDEAVDGHPLYEKGLEVYCAHIVENSSWIKELKTIHSVHPQFSEESWRSDKHYLLFFHDEIFEVIAKDHQIEVFHDSFSEVYMEATRRLNK